MAVSNYTKSFEVDRSPIEVYNAINNVRDWWSEEIEGNTNQLNSEWNYHYQDVHKCKMKITSLDPGKKVVWLVLDNYFSFTQDKNEWKGNELIFEITEKGNKTQLKFTQTGLTPQYECYDICQNAWDTYIQKSLSSLITTGKGQPNGKDKPRTETEKELGNSNFTTTMFVNETPKEVYNAIMNVRGWWQGEITGNTEKINEEFSYKMEDVHYSKQQIVELIPDKKVVWMVTDSKLNFIDKKNEWNGTKISFEISEINNKTQLRFTHYGLVPQIECYDGCSKGWEALIQQSLFSLITTGKGMKVF